MTELERAQHTLWLARSKREHLLGQLRSAYTAQRRRNVHFLLDRNQAWIAVCEARVAELGQPSEPPR